MEEMKRGDKNGTPIEDTLPTYRVPNKTDAPTAETIRNDYKWREHEIHGHVFSTTAQHVLNDEGWIYRDDLEWVWVFGSDQSFLYSVDYGWFYAMAYRSHRLLYWYDRRYWLLAGEFDHDIYK